MPPRPINFLPPPYPYWLNVDVSRGNWNVIPNILVCELRCVALTADQYFEIRIGLDDRIVTLRGRGENIWRVQLDRIFQFNTTPEIRQNCIEIFGYFRDSIEQYTGV